MNPKVYSVFFRHGDVARIKVVRLGSRTRLAVYDHWDGAPLIQAILSEGERQMLVAALGEGPDTGAPAVPEVAAPNSAKQAIPFIH